MAERRINLNNFKSSGVYTVEIDQSENVALPLTTGRLIVGSSRVGPFNTVVLINDLRTLRSVFGEIDPKLEKAGGYFHRSIEVALREGPVFALNVMPVDTDENSVTNQDQVYFTTFNTESTSNNSTGNPVLNPIVDFFNKRRLWFASSEQLNRTKNLALGDDFVTNPGGLGMVSIPSNKVLSFVNTGKSNITIWTRRADTTGFDITAREWYNTVRTGEDVEFPNFVHPDDFISDYMVEVITISGDWTNYLRLANDPIYNQFFDESGLIESRASDFFALREIRVISRTVGCLIPDFIDQSGNSISIDRLVNRVFPSTGVLCALDTDKLDLVDLTTTAFNDVEVDTHRLDLIGHGYDELNSGDVYTADDGGFETDGVTAADATPLIDTLSYRRPADANLIFKITSSETEADFLAGTTIPTSVGDLYEITPTSGDPYLVAMAGSKLYESYANGFLKTGDIITNGTLDYYIKTQDNFTITVSGTEIKYIKVFVYSDITLLNQEDVGNISYAAGGDDYIKIETEAGSDFKATFDLTDTNYFTDFTITQPNKIVVGINTSNTANKAEIDEFIKVNHFIKAQRVGDVRPRLLKIISVTSREELSPYRLEYTITTMAPSVDEISGLDVTNNEIQVYKGVYNFVTSIRGQYLKGFKIRESLLPNGTAQRQQDILQYLFDNTSIPQALASKEVIDFRYVVDTYEGEISSSSKYYLAKLAALHGQAMALLNTPSVDQFEKSVDPSFINSNNKLLSAELISKGGDLDLNPSFLFKFAEEDVNGVPLSSYSTFYFPNLIIRNGNRNISVPPAAYISNLYVRKFKNGTPFLIVAGGKRGVITDPELVGVEYELTNDDRDFLEPVGHNLIVKRRGFGTLLFSNNTAYQRVNSALNNAHVRDNLSTIERDISRILFNFLFDFNDEITRLRVKTIVENYLDAVVNARGLSSYEVVFDSSNNTNEVIENNAAIIDVIVDFPRGIHKFINRITITRVGGQLSSESTGFTPSF
jgi:hypothetical protein